MPIPRGRHDPPGSLSRLVKPGDVWPLADTLPLVHRVALEVQALHRSGRVHLALDAEHITLDGQFQPHLAPPPLWRFFGAAWVDPDSFPPELAEASAIELPSTIEEARGVLASAGHQVDPRRIDVYQLGALLCRLLTGRSVEAYLLNQQLRATLPACVQEMLDRTWGFDSASRLNDCEQFVAALRGVLDRLGAPGSNSAPAPDQAAVPGSDLPAGSQPSDGSIAASPVDERLPGASGDLPFRRLGQFEVVAQIGRGGMGSVYKAYDASLDRSVALKVLPPDLAREEEFLRRFHAEAAATAQVVHPNVVSIFFVGQDAGHHFFAMQFIDGESLAERLARGRSLAVEEAVGLVRQCLAGLDAAHALGLIHRDVKPGNILIERETGRAVLVDFGLVRRLTGDRGITVPGTIMGTVDYIAPEQARGLPADRRTDLYSVGVVLYQMLAGRLPFEADTPAGMMFRHAYDPPPALADLALEVPPALAAIVARLLEKDPALRYQTAGEPLEDLDAFQRGEPPAAPPAAAATVAGFPAPTARAGLAPVSPAARHGWRWPWVLALGALAVLLSTLLAVRIAAWIAAKPPVAPGPDELYTPAEISPGVWVDLLTKVNVTRDKINGEWMPSGNAVVHVRGAFSSLRLPVSVEGDYDLQVEFTRESGDTSVGVVFPVGPSFCTLWLSGYNGKCHGLEAIDGEDCCGNPSTHHGGSLMNHREYAVLIQVRHPGEENVGIQVLLDGQPCTGWTGNIHSLSVSPQFGALTPNHPNLGAYEAPTTFHRVRLRVVSGKAEWSPP